MKNIALLLAFYEGVNQKSLIKSKRPIFRIGRLLARRGFDHVINNLMDSPKWGVINFQSRFHGNCNITVDLRDVTVMRIKSEKGQVWEFRNFGNGINFVCNGLTNVELYRPHKMYEVKK